MAGGRSFAAGHYALELDGESAGWLMNAQGGGAVADVVQEKVGADHFVGKHIGQVRYEDIVVTFAGGMSKALYEWLGQASRNKMTRKNGALIVSDGSYKEQRRLEFFAAVITELQFPALDANSKDPFALTVKISPERTRTVTGSGKASASVHAGKPWSTSAFHFTIDGLEEPCKYVSRIEPLSLTAKTTSEAVGQTRQYELVLTAVNPSNIGITLREGKAEKFRDWFQDFVINGNHGPSQEKNGSLATGPFTLSFGHLGPFRMSATNLVQHKDSPALVQVEMYCESMDFTGAGG